MSGEFKRAKRAVSERRIRPGINAGLESSSKSIDGTDFRVGQMREFQTASSCRRESHVNSDGLNAIADSVANVIKCVFQSLLDLVVVALLRTSDGHG